MGVAGDPVLRLLVQVAVLLAVARLLGEVARRLGQPAVVGEILAGVLLGPSLLGPLLGGWLDVPRDHGVGLDTLQLLAAMFLLLLTGLEMDLSLVRAHLRTAASVSLGGVVVTFASGLLLARAMPDALVGDPDHRLPFELFVATAMSVSAIPVIAKVLMDLGLLRRTIGQTMLASGMIDDAVAWSLLAVVLGLANAEGASALHLLLAASKVAVLWAVVGTVGRWAVALLLQQVQDRMAGPGRLLSLVVVVAFGLGAVSHALGVEAVLGAFAAGVLFGSMPRLPSTVRHHLEALTIGVFAPLFFAVAGLRVDLRALAEPRLLGVALAALAVAVGGKLVGTFLGARLLAGKDTWTALAFGAGLNARGAVEIILASIGLAAGILAEPAYTVIVMVAVVTSLLAPFGLRFALARVPLDADEQVRLRREAAEATSLLPQARRALVPVRLRPAGREDEGLRDVEARLLRLLPGKVAVSLVCVVAAEEDRGRAQAFLGRLARDLRPLDAQARVIVATDVVGALLEESARDYDLVLLGFPADPDRAAGLGRVLDGVLRYAPCPVLLAAGSPPPDWQPRRLLVPTNGSRASVRAAETAFSLAKAAGPGAEVTVVHVVREVGGLFLPPTAALDERRAWLAAWGILKHVQELGRALGVAVTSDVVSAVEPAGAVLTEARLIGADLLVVGTEVRPGGEGVHLGRQVERMLAEAPCVVLVVNAT